MFQKLAFGIICSLLAVSEFSKVLLVDGLENSPQRDGVLDKASKDESDYHPGLFSTLKNNLRSELEAEFRQEMIKIQENLREHIDMKIQKVFANRKEVDCGDVNYCVASNITDMKIKSDKQDVKIFENKINIDRVVEIELEEQRQELNELQMKIKNLEEKPRFIAEVHTSPGNVLPVGNVEDYNELLDVGSNFDPYSGYFTVPEDNSIFVFFVDADKPDNLKEDEVNIMIKVNGAVVQHFWENDEENGTHIAGLVGLRLNKGDRVNVENYFPDSIMAKATYPFTFMGIQM